MVIVIDENVSLTLASALRQAGYEVIAIAETAERGMVMLRSGNWQRHDVQSLLPGTMASLTRR